MFFLRTYPKVGCCKSVAGRDVGASRGVGVVGIDVGQQGGHVGRHPGAQVLGRQAVEVTEIYKIINIFPILSNPSLSILLTSWLDKLTQSRI